MTLIQSHVTSYNTDIISLSETFIDSSFETKISKIISQVRISFVVIILQTPKEIVFVHIIKNHLSILDVMTCEF